VEVFVCYVGQLEVYSALDRSPMQLLERWFRFRMSRAIGQKEMVQIEQG